MREVTVKEFVKAFEGKLMALNMQFGHGTLNR